MKVCKWCHETYDENAESPAFCSNNPNREKNLAKYFDDDKKWKKLHRYNGKSLLSIVAKIKIMRIVIK